MNFIILSKLIFSLIFVIGLIFLTAYLFSKLKEKNIFNSVLPNVKSINIVETKLIDSKQKLILVKINNIQYFVLLSTNGNLILDKIEINKNFT